MKKQFLKRCTAMICSAALLMGVAGYMPSYAESENLITNSTFDSDTKGWSYYAHKDAAASLGVEDQSLALTVSALGSVNYAVQLGSNIITLNQGSYYRVTFDISSTADRYVDAIVQENGNGYQAFAAKGINLTAETQKISLVFAMESETAQAKLVFNCGNHSEVLPEHTIFIDNVVIEEVDESQAEVYSPYEPPITVNQLGYKLDASKIAVFRNITSEREFSVIDAADNKTVFTGELYGKRENPTADEVNWYGDFSSVTAPGRYYISCGELDDSYTFEISDSVYSGLLDDAVRMLYLQRCGCEVVDETFGHPECHTGKAVVYGTNELKDVSGGWHDAGDYGRYVVPAAKAVADIMLAYEANPFVHSDNIGIPESGNGVPDILDEARYEIEWMMKMQTGSGGVYHQVNCETFPGNVMPEKETNTLYLAPVSTAATADFCAVAAMAYEYYLDFDAEFANRCLASAEKAWGFLQNNPDMIYDAPEDLDNVGYSDSTDGDERYWAACQMYRATGDESYLKAIENITSRYYKDGLEWHMVGHYGNIALLNMDGIDKSSAEYAKAKEMLFNWVNVYMGHIAETGYETAVEKYTWGSSMTVANAGIVLAIAYELTGDESYIIGAEKQLHYLLGRNPNGMCYVTGYGTASPENPHHRPSIAKGTAMTGMLVGGVNSDLADPAAQKYLKDSPPDKCYVDDEGSYSTNEITIYWNSPLIYLLSLTESASAKNDVIPEGWLLWHSYSDYSALDSRLYLRTPDGKTEEITGDFIHAMNGSFSTSPDQITFMAIDSKADEWDIYVAENGKTVNLTQNSGFRNEDPKWSPDGKSIVFKRGRWDNSVNGFVYDLALLDVKTRAVTMLTDDLTEEAMPCFSDDGKTIYYTGYKDGIGSIYAIDTASGKVSTIYSESGVNAYYPIVNGNDLYFTRWYSKDNHCDQLVRWDGKKLYELPFNSDKYDCSDACPIDSGKVIFSSTMNGSYDLYCYDGSNITPLSELNSDINELGADFFPCTIRGDVNADGSFNIADAVMLQKWLIGAGDIINWRAGDLLSDSQLDVFDLCLMKIELTA